MCCCVLWKQAGLKVHVEAKIAWKSGKNLREEEQRSLALVLLLLVLLVLILLLVLFLLVLLGRW